MDDLRSLIYSISSDDGAKVLESILKVEENTDKGLNIAAESAVKISGSLNGIGNLVETFANTDEGLTKIASSIKDAYSK